MDGKIKRARTEEMAAGCDAAAPSPARKAPLPDDEPDVAAAEESGGVEDDEDDDEQVERFYALLANIRALRGLLPPPPHVAPSSSCGGGASSRKRLRDAEPAWRPAFRMEDFEEPAAPAPLPSKRKHITEGGDGDAASVARPAVAVAPSSPRHAAVARSDSGSCKN